MPRTLAILLIALSCALIVVAGALAELPRELKKSASFIVTGRVSKVFKRRDPREHNEFLVQIRIEVVERGEGFREGDVIYAFAFQRRPDGRPETAAAGHRAIPKEGQRIRAWIRHSKGEMKALYPEWFEVLTPSEEPKGTPGD